MPNPASVIQSLVAPVVMISASGLLCLAYYNRLAAVVSRLRAFHHDQSQTIVKLSALPLDEQASSAAHALREHLAALESQDRALLLRARLIRNALMGLLTGVQCMLTCSLSIGVAQVYPPFLYVALGLFILGVLSMILALGFSMRELARSLQPVSLEASRLRGARS